MRRWAAAGLLASLVAVAGCSTAVSDASPTTTDPSTTTTTSTTAAPSTTTSSSSSTTSLQPPTTVPPGMDAALAGLWSRTPPASCLMVLDGAGVVFERNPDAPVTPASTLKLVTAHAALTRLGPASRLTTRVTSTARPALDGTLGGDVFLVGGGDPVLGTLAYGASFEQQPHLLSALEVLADRLREAGVRRITGRVLGDDSRYDTQRYVPSWSPSYVSDHEAGPLSALLVNNGAEKWGRRDVPFADPALGAAQVFTDVLRQRGVSVDGAAGSGTSGFGAADLATMDSPTIGELVQEMLLDSNNNSAELLLKELGLQVLGRPTTEAGLQVVKATLATSALPLDGLTLNDGSGLDRGDRITCRLLGAVLSTSPVRYQIAMGLPVAGESGTLWRRFRRTPVAGRLRAKTGTIRGVAALAGYADRGGRQLTFAYVQNGPGSGSGLEDELGRILVG